MRTSMSLCGWVQAMSRNDDGLEVEGLPNRDPRSVVCFCVGSRKRPVACDEGPSRKDCLPGNKYDCEGRLSATPTDLWE